ncbi:hypothetical protein PFFVO_02489 [Plasmodium falciparum Vietnam Oak-Knoll (FVO)]|uniref:Uncharacterized protein n=1 Tax=Plasmodium falciparum Vietnam Oak-Knoll (FVO) TaxID=1036723 RepID=A0A024V8R5_PLAFA|nr:hypothetical protein PFFVO_02489 [Plasmodium falciparum Vietnam Oak-Knoll (FVO)]
MSIVKIIFRRKKYIILQNSNIHFININQYKYNLSIKYLYGIVHIINIKGILYICNNSSIRPIIQINLYYFN